MIKGSESILILTAFELRKRLREPATILAGLILFSVLLLGHINYWQTLPPRPADDRMFGYAFIGAALLLLRFGVAEDRQLALDVFLTSNLISPARYFTSKLLTGITILLAIAVSAFVFAFALSGLDIRYAAWYMLLFTLAAWIFLPAILLIETLTDIRLAAPAALVAFIILIMVLSPTYGTPRVVGWLGLDIERFNLQTLGPLTVRAAVATGLLVALAPLTLRRLRG